MINVVCNIYKQSDYDQAGRARDLSLSLSQTQYHHNHKKSNANQTWPYVVFLQIILLFKWFIVVCRYVLVILIAKLGSMHVS